MAVLGRIRSASAVANARASPVGRESSAASAAAALAASPRAAGAASPHNLPSPIEIMRQQRELLRNEVY